MVRLGGFISLLDVWRGASSSSALRFFILLLSLEGGKGAGSGGRILKCRGWPSFMELFGTKNWHKGRELDLKKTSLCSAAGRRAGSGRFSVKEGD